MSELVKWETSGWGISGFVVLWLLLSCTAQQVVVSVDSLEGGPPDSGTEEVDSGPDSGGDSDSIDSDTDDTDSDDFNDIFVINAHNRNIYRFAPPAKQFTLVGALENGDLVPGEITVAQNGLGFVLFRWNDICEGIHVFNLTTLKWVKRLPFSCAIDPYPWDLAFTADSSNPDGESLFFTGVYAKKDSLVRVDTTSGNPQVMGEMALIGAALTGTPDGELWGFAGVIDDLPMFRIDESNAEIVVRHPMIDLLFPDGLPQRVTYWAIARWGGDFFLFLTLGEAQESLVFRVTSSDEFQDDVQAELYIDGTGEILVQSAGVSIGAAQH